MFTLSAARSILQALTGQSQYVALAPTCYVGFSTTAPSLDGTGFTEPSEDAGYERILAGSQGQSLTQLFGGASVSDDGSKVVMTNTQNIKSNRASASWGTLTHILFFTAKTGGILMAYQALTSPVTVAAGESVQINKGELDLSLN